MDLNLFKTFVTVVDAGSMTQASLRLKQPISRVSRSINRLEKNLNQHLILRTTRSFQITDAGRKLFVNLQPIISQLNQIQKNLNDSSEDLSGTVKVTAPEDFGINLFGPIILELQHLFPDLVIDLNLTDEYVDLIKTETDIGIRAGFLKDSTLKSKKLGTSVFHFVASIKYLEKYGEPKKPQELVSHKCIHALFGQNSSKNIWKITNGNRNEKIELKPIWRGNHKGVALDLTLSGMGITLLPKSLLSNLIENGSLVHILKDWTLEPSPLHLVFPPQRITSKKVRVVAAFLEEKLKQVFQ